MGYGTKGLRELFFILYLLIINTKPIVQYVYMDSIHACSVKKIKIGTDCTRGFLFAMHIA